MKKVSPLFLAVMTFVVIALPALAAWDADINAAIKKGDISQIGIIQAANPAAQPKMAMFLLEKAKSALDGGDACLAVNIFEATTPILSQVSSGDKDAAKAILSSMHDTASNASNADNECAKKLLSDLDNLDSALLAQVPGALPNIGARGALTPSAE